MNVEERLQSIRDEAAKGKWSGEPHVMADKLLIDVLQAIVEDATDAAGLASLALTVQDIDFPRWYE